MTTTNAIYKHIFEFSPSPIAIFAADGECLLANRAFYVQLGYDLDEGEKPPLVWKIYFFYLKLCRIFVILLITGMSFEGGKPN